MPGEAVTIDHEEGGLGGRFLARFPDGSGVLNYRVAGPDLLDFEHVEVSPSLRGKGMAGRIVEAACRFARERGSRVVPTCPYIAWWFRQHPEQQDLLLTREPGS